MMKDMSNTEDRCSNSVPTPLTGPSLSPRTKQQTPSNHDNPEVKTPPSPSSPLTPSTNPTQAIYAPLPTRRMLSQLLRQWQQSFGQQTQPLSPTKDTSIISPSQPAAAGNQEASPRIDTTVPQTPQSSRTPSRLFVSPQYTTPTSTSPTLSLTTPQHARRASITNFLPAESLLVSPIPRARNPGGFRPTSSGSIGEIDEFEGFSPFGEVSGLVGGWEEKIRNPTAWAVVNTTNPANAPSMEPEEMEGGRKSKSVDVNG